MARGWESKAVESQQEALRDKQSSGRSSRPEPASAPRRILELARIRAAAQLKTATLPNHRATLERAIADLEVQLESLD